VSFGRLAAAYASIADEYERVVRENGYRFDHAHRQLALLAAIDHTTQRLIRRFTPKEGTNV
jgi:hypothetical protein